MPPQTKKIIVVFGATGNQGSSVALTFLSLPNWHVRCITRSPLSPAAVSLTSSGAEVIQADISDPSSLFPALTNANAIFLNTDFWAIYQSALSDPATASKASELGFEYELQNGKNVVDAVASIPELERFVYSALGPADRHSKGKYPSMHWDAKAGIVDYISSTYPSLKAKTSYIYLGAYNTNAFLTPHLNPATDTHQFIMPFRASSRMPIIDPKHSTGPFVRALIEDEKPDTALLAYDPDSYVDMYELVRMWIRVTGKKAEFVQTSREDMNARFGIPMEILAGPAFIDEFGYMGGVERYIEPKDLERKVKTVSFENWLNGRQSA